MNFKREIKCWQGFEMWTRILCWDRKWFYVVTWFVEKGSVKPKGWTLQPWRNKQPVQGREIEGEDAGTKREAETRKGAHPAIFATGLAKYVCKRGRITVPPERILGASGLLPPKPKEHKTPPMTESPAVPIEGDALPTAVASAASATIQAATADAADDLLRAALNAKSADRGGWDWDRVEQERLRGMKIAEAWCQTEALGEEFLGDERPALGKWWDFPGI